MNNKQIKKAMYWLERKVMLKVVAKHFDLTVDELTQLIEDYKNQ